MKHKINTLLILTPGFPGSEEDSTCLPAQQVMLRALKKKFPFVQFIILSLEYPFTDIPYRWGGNTVIPFNNRNRAKWYRLRMFIKVWRTMTRLKKEHQLIGLFSFWHGECAFLGKYFAKFHGLKHYNWILGQDAREGNKYAPLIRSKPDELLAISESVSEQFYLHYSVKPAHILPNGIDPGLFPTVIGTKDIDILGAGSLTALKRYAIWVRTAGLISELRPGTNALLCGKGPELGSLRQMVLDRGWENSLMLSGEVPHQELLGLMKRCKVFLHPSSYEGFSTACMEALYAGAHVISFTHPEGTNIPHWHVVHSESEMLETALALLGDRDTDYQPVLLHHMEDNAVSVMELFGVME